MELSTVNDVLADVHRDRLWIVLAEVSAGSAGFVTQLESWGAAGVIVVAGAPGVGEQPDARVVFTQAEASATMMEGMRQFFRSVMDPDDEVAAAVNAFDPRGEALVTLPDVHVAKRVFGRPVYGARSAETQALEDKTLIDELWDTADVDRVPSEVVPVHEAPAAAARLSQGQGTVWAADNLLGWHGGGTYTQWIRPSADLDDAVAWFAACSRSVRVMPFLDGIPCSIHGFVTRSGVASFRPVEMLTLRRPDRAFLYGGVASYWDPTAADRAHMREVARRVAAELGDRIGYLGPFSVDGVMTVEGFRPTELNPRMSAGMGQLASTVDGLQLGSIVRCLREGDLEVDPQWLERVVLESADENRVGGAYTVAQGRPFPQDRLEEFPVSIRYEGGRVSRAEESEANGSIVGGNNPAGAYVRLNPDPERIDHGPSLGPMAVALMEFADAEWDLGIGPVEAAPDLRAAAIS